MKQIALVLILFTASCSLIKKPKVYTLDPYWKKIYLNKDGTYKISDNISFGKWYKYGRTYILESEYKKNEIKSISLQYSKSKKSSYSILFIKHVRTKAMVNKAKVNLYFEKECNTQLINQEENNFLKIEKVNHYDSISITLIDNKLNLNYKEAYSEKYPINTESDTIEVLIDALGTSYNYEDFDYEVLFKRKNHLLRSRTVVKRGYLDK